MLNLGSSIEDVHMEGERVMPKVNSCGHGTGSI